MKSYDLRCPICGAVNRGLYLEETDGWMECEKCGNVTQSMEHRQTVLIPLILKTQSRSDNNKVDRLAVGM
ncbi:MAG: translation initiation factor 2 [Blautia sp.]|jgi:uncharacterized Zn finger protein|nr:translation initiation factor 2 [Blautia sp.]